MKKSSLLMVITFFYGVNQVYAEEDLMKRYNDEARGYLSGVKSNNSADNLKEVDGFNQSPNETSFSEEELRVKADEMMQGNHIEKEGVHLVIDAVKSSTNNKHRSKHTVKKLQDKDFIKKSKSITLNPLANINVTEDIDCNIGDDESSRADFNFEEYYVDIEDTRLINEDKKCEEDEDKLFYCSRGLKEIKCQKKGECEFNVGGIEEGAIASDMQFTYNYPYLTVGTIANNYWGGTCAIYDRRTKFNIRDLKNIKDFKIIEVGFDDYLRIVVNGTQVYNGPYGGDKLEIGHNVFGVWNIDTGNGRYSCELNTNWNFAVNIDLIPYLKEGENIIDTRVEVSGGGEGWLKMLVSQYCCSKWEEDVWEGDCPVN